MFNETKKKRTEFMIALVFMREYRYKCKFNCKCARERSFISNSIDFPSAPTYCFFSIFPSLFPLLNGHTQTPLYSLLCRLRVHIGRTNFFIFQLCSFFFQSIFPILKFTFFYPILVYILPSYVFLPFAT